MALIISRRSFYCPNFATAPEKEPSAKHPTPTRRQTPLLAYRPSLDTPGRKRKDLDATKLDWLDVATKVIVLVTVIVKLVTAMLHVGL